MNVQAVVTWVDSAGVVLATDISLVDLEVLPPGGIAVYQTRTHTLKGMSGFEVQFQSDLGQFLLARGDRRGSISVPATTERNNVDVVPTSGTPSTERLPPP